MERGKTGTLHAQGYIEFTTSQRLTALAKLLHGAHWEARKGPRDAAREYCSKSDGRVSGPYEGGHWTPQKRGRRSDIIALREAAQAGRSELSIADDDELTPAWFKYYKGLDRYKRLCAGDRDWKTTVIVYRGESGAGKSKRALAEFPGAYWQQRGQWWDGYWGQAVIVLDDYDGWLPLTIFLRLMDRYPMMVETKGGQSTFLARTIVITTNYNVCDWYPKQDEQRQKAIKRRIDEEWQFITGKDAFRVDPMYALEVAPTQVAPTQENECTECEEEACDCQGPV